MLKVDNLDYLKKNGIHLYGYKTLFKVSVVETVAVSGKENVNLDHESRH